MQADWTLAAFLLLRRALLDKIGGFYGAVQTRQTQQTRAAMSGSTLSSYQPRFSRRNSW